MHGDRDNQTTPVPNDRTMMEGSARAHGEPPPYGDETVPVLLSPSLACPSPRARTAAPTTTASMLKLQRPIQSPPPPPSSRYQGERRTKAHCSLYRPRRILPLPPLRTLPGFLLVGTPSPQSDDLWPTPRTRLREGQAVNTHRFLAERQTRVEVAPKPRSAPMLRPLADQDCWGRGVGRPRRVLCATRVKRNQCLLRRCLTPPAPPPLLLAGQVWEVFSV